MISSLRTQGLRALVMVLLVCGLGAPRASLGAVTALRIDSKGDYIGFGLVRDFTEADGTFPPHAREALAVAVNLATGLGGSRLVVGLVGAAVQPAANQIAGCGAAQRKNTA